jgi:hypothetical protein
MSERRRIWVQKTFGVLAGRVVDGASKPVTNYTVVVFPERRLPATSQSFSFTVGQRGPADVPSTTDPGRFETHLLPGRYLLVAVGSGLERDPERLARLKTRATSVTLAAGDSKILDLTLSTD